MPYPKRVWHFFIWVRGLAKPEGFCDWAWDDIHKCVMTLQFGGDFGCWMKKGNTIVVCCTDGIRPVVFGLERIDGLETRI